MESHRHLGDHGQRSLRAHKEAGEVVTRRCLRRSRAGANDASVGEDCLERQHVGTCLSVPHSGRTRGIRRCHPSERRISARVDGEEEAVLADGSLERESRHSGLHGRGEVLRRDVEDAVESREVEADTAMDGNHVALEARSHAERRHGDTVLVRECEHA